MSKNPKSSGAIAWMAKNRVTANLLMLAFIVGGMIMMTQVKQEVFPEFELDIITVNVPYPGASPEEVEKGILLAVEEGVRGLDGVKRVTATAREGFGSVTIELLLGANGNKLLQDVKNAVDRITSFPQDAERPVVSLLVNRQQVISLVVHGDQTETVLKQVAEEVREELLENANITLVELSGVRTPEISIEVPQENLRRYNLTLNGVARLIDAAALELPGGSVKTEGGEVLVRTTERRDHARQYAELPVITRNDGTIVRLADIAIIKETFEDTDLSAVFDGGDRAVMVNVFRVGDQTPREVSEIAREYIERKGAELPASVSISVWNDQSEILNDRIELLLRNALFGLVLVLILLSLFLDIKLAFWVTLGIPISVLGAMLFMPGVDVSINMISLFAIIVTIGIVVDDAIVVGENIFSKRQKGMPFLEAAIDGAKQMAVPVTFAILTNIAAFMPLLFVPGITGKFFKVIPQVVIVIFLVSLVEALFILPAHLSHGKAQNRGVIAWLNRKRGAVARFIVWLNERTYQPFLRVALRWRYVTIGIAVLVFMVTIGMVGSGRVEFTFMPKIESERISATAQLPFGAPVEQTREVQQRLLGVAREIIGENGGDDIVRGIFSQIGQPPARTGPVSIGSGLTGGHLTNVQIYLVTIDKRDITAEEFVTEWNNRLGDIPGVETISFQYNAGPSAGKPVSFLISHPDTATLEQAANELAKGLEGYAGLRDIDDGFTGGKPQIDFKIKPAAQALGITARDLALQVRGAFYGAEALRNQRGRDEVRVYVRLPKEERRSEYNIEELIIRAPNGTEIPLGEAAEVIRGTSYTQIQRTDGRRVLTVSADIIQGKANAAKVIASVEQGELPAVIDKYGVTYLLDGEQRDQRDAMGALGIGFVFAMFAIFALLAIPFKSYSQPVIIMTAIPFGIVGAVVGHAIMGYELSIISMFGVVALAGVVVNGGLILINEANQSRWRGASVFDSAVYAGGRRFRPIVLTSVSTFVGLAPMIFETSLQARFLIPMAISLGFGILFSTGISLVLAPCLYMALFDIKRLFGMKDEVPQDYVEKIAEEKAAEQAKQPSAQAAAMK